MKEIKFRAWDKAEKEMVNVTQINWEFDTLTISHDSSWHNDIEAYELMQYTGLKDKNGMEIYEGDMLKRKHQKKIYVVEHQLMFINHYKMMTGFVLPSNGENLLCEIIGNIYENPELIDENNN